MAFFFIISNCGGWGLFKLKSYLYIPSFNLKNLVCSWELLNWEFDTSWFAQTSQKSIAYYHYGRLYYNSIEQIKL